VIQIETAMGAAIEVFDAATTIEVGRDRFVPVKTTNDLLVLRSDCYALSADYVLNLLTDAVPFVDLDSSHFKFVSQFDGHFPEGVPSLKGAESLTVQGDWVFGAGVTVTGNVLISEPETGSSGHIPSGTRLGEG